MIVVAVDALLLLVPLEALALLLWHRRTGRGVGPRGLLANLAAGLSLAAALRCALGAAVPSPAGQAGIAAFMAAAGLFHLCDLAFRWRR